MRPWVPRLNRTSVGLKRIDRHRAQRPIWSLNRTSVGLKRGMALVVIDTVGGLNRTSVGLKLRRRA